MSLTIPVHRDRMRSWIRALQVGQSGAVLAEIENMLSGHGGWEWEHLERSRGITSKLSPLCICGHTQDNHYRLTTGDYLNCNIQGCQCPNFSASGLKADPDRDEASTVQRIDSEHDAQVKEDVGRLPRLGNADDAEGVSADIKSAEKIGEEMAACWDAGLAEARIRQAKVSVEMSTDGEHWTPLVYEPSTLADVRIRQVMASSTPKQLAEMLNVEETEEEPEKWDGGML